MPTRSKDQLSSAKGRAVEAVGSLYHELTGEVVTAVLPEEEGLSPAEIKEQVSVLRQRFEEERRKRDLAEAEGRSIHEQIQVLQRKCPHQNTREEPRTSGQDVKYEEVCLDCGKEVPW